VGLQALCAVTERSMIFEGLITTSNRDGSAHVTPMGFRREQRTLLVRPFVPSLTLDNLMRSPQAVMNLADDVRLTAGCLTGRRDWPLVAADSVRGWRVQDCLAYLEVVVTGYEADVERPTFRCQVVKEINHRAYQGFSRAQAAVIEASILVSRLDFIDSIKLEAELTYLHIAVAKTAGEYERTAWRWLLDAVHAHPRHSFEVDNLR
jgi:hypothetical protein